MRKVIGVMPLYDAEKKSYWIQPRYLQMLEAENAIPLVLPLTTNHYELDYFIEICGGFLLSGGHDVSPAVVPYRALLPGADPAARHEMKWSNIF